ncbi:hypothetical protein [Massilia sp.]|uniref:hypothetical protein n=1 Tax=Massilia sp. TaxID=1882437 RepID=UPI00352DC8E3
MAGQMEKPPKIGTEITVRISLTFQEAPDVHTLLAMTPVRERGKLVRLALERYIAETGHSAGDVEQQIDAISTWLRSRATHTATTACIANPLEVNRTIDATTARQFHNVAAPQLARGDSAPEEVDTSSLSIKRWLEG